MSELFRSKSNTSIAIIKDKTNINLKSLSENNLNNSKKEPYNITKGSWEDLHNSYSNWMNNCSNKHLKEQEFFSKIYDLKTGVLIVFISV